MPRAKARAVLAGLAVLVPAVVVQATPISVYGVWHCGDDFCTWRTVRDLAEFDQRNRWIVDRGDGRPSVNLVVLSFVHPLRLLNRTTDADTLNGVPRGMTTEVVGYFKSRGIRVMLSIGGITYVDPWDEALAQDAWQLGLNAAQVAQQLGVGIEIDYEQNRNPDLAGLQAFIDAYRSVLPYDPSGADPAARLTIDVAAGNRWLIDINKKAAADWLDPTNPVLDYANAMVTARPYRRTSDAIANWNEHVTGYLQTAPLAPAKFTGSLWLTSNRSLAECTDFAASLQSATGDYVQNVAPAGAGNTPGMLGYMFWAAECQGTRALCTTPPNTCEGGVGTGATAYAVPIPMPPLRQN